MRDGDVSIALILVDVFSAERARTRLYCCCMRRGQHRNRIVTVTLVLAFVCSGLGAFVGSGKSVTGAFVYGYVAALVPFCLLGLCRRLVRIGQASDNPARVVRWSKVHRLMMFPVVPTGTEAWEASAHEKLGTLASYIDRLDRKSVTQPFARLLRGESERDYPATKVSALAVLAGSLGLEEKLSALAMLARVDPGAALEQRFSTPGFGATELADITLLVHCGVETPVRIAGRLGVDSVTVQAVVMFRRGRPAEAVALLDEFERTHELTAADRKVVERLRTRHPAPFIPTERESALIRRLEDGLADAVRVQLADGPPMTIRSSAGA